MRITRFEGLIPKISDKALPDGKGTIAVNMDVYGNHLRPIKLPRSTGEKLLTPCGDVFTGTPVSIHRAGSILVAWDKLVFTSVDWTRKLGETTFLFVDNGKLYRQSAERILRKDCPIEVGIKRPDKAQVVAEPVDMAGCPPTRIDNICVPIDENCDSVEHPPVPVSYLFTYINSCGEESAHSKPSEVVDIQWGDAAKVTVTDEPPHNAVKRRWYRAVTDNEGIAHWLKVGETPIEQTTFFDTNCPCDFSCELSTEDHDAPPDCLDGVVAIGDNQVIVWSNKHFWVSENNFPHAYNINNEYRLRYHIKGMYEVTTTLEGRVHYTVIAITDGLHYTLATDNPDTVEITEIQQRYKCLNFNTVCQSESEVVYIAPQGLVSVSMQGENLLTGVLMTENEWQKYDLSNLSISYHDDRLYGFNRQGGFIMQMGADKRRDLEFVEHNVVVDRGFTDETSHLLVFVGNNIYEWGAGSVATYDWKSKTEMMAGLWRPTTCKVVSPDFDNAVPKGLEEARIKYLEWTRKFPTADKALFFAHNPEYQQHYSYLVNVRPFVTVVIYADNREYFRRKVSSNKPFYLPRRHKAIDWSIRVIGSIRIDEIHMQGSRESLLGSD